MDVQTKTLEHAVFSAGEQQFWPPRQLSLLTKLEYLFGRVCRVTIIGAESIPLFCLLEENRAWINEGMIYKRSRPPILLHEKFHKNILRSFSNSETNSNIKVARVT